MEVTPVIQVSYRDARPIYEQVRDAYRQQILSGVLPMGTKMPSVRELSTQLAINPNTIQRAYAELEREGCIYSVRGRGSYVADVSDVTAARRDELLLRLDELVSELEQLGCKRSDLAKRVQGGEDHGSGD